MASSIVVLLGGDVDELLLLRAARLAGASLRHASVKLCWLPSCGRSVAHPLLEQLAGEPDFDQVTTESLGDLLFEGRVETVMLAPSLWRRLGALLLRRLNGASAYICRRGSLPPARVLCCADSDATARQLLSRVARVLPMETTSFSLLRAVPPIPSWLTGLMAVGGYAVLGDQGKSEGSRLRSGFRELVVNASAADAATAAYLSEQPDVCVLGWHHHSIHLPVRWQHPTAWRLSTRFPGDVLLVPLRD